MKLLLLRLFGFLFLDRRDNSIGGEGPLYVVGSLRAATGLGESARLYLHKLRAAGIQIYGVDATVAMVQQPILELSQEDGPYLTMDELHRQSGGGTVVIHANPPLFHLLLLRLGKQFLRNKRVVGYWAWELEKLPYTYVSAIPYADAFEVPSEFVASAVRLSTKKDVHVFSYPIRPVVHKKNSYCSTSVMRCLYIFSMASLCERKNPWAAVAAFAKAFPDGKQASLTLKVSQATAEPENFARLQALVDKTPGVQIITGDLSSSELDEMYLAHDVYFSPHRSEGYGLTIQEALLRGLHVVATGWSGNMEFMKGDHAHLLPYTLIPVAPGSIPLCPPGVRWADVDIAEAANILRQLQHDLTAQETSR